MKKIVNKWNEYLSVNLLRPTPGRKVQDRAVAQLAVGGSIVVGDEEVSPELLRLEKKGRVTIEDVTPPEKQEDAPPQEEEMSEEDLKKLEQDLLAEEDDPEDEPEIDISDE